MSIQKIINLNKGKDLEEIYLEYYNIKTPLCVCGKFQKFINTSKGYSGYCSVECKQKIEKYNKEMIFERIRTEEELTFSSYEYRKIMEYMALSSEDIYLIKYPNSDRCEVCGGKCSFVNAKVGFLKTCSYVCGNSLPRRKLNELEKNRADAKRRRTNLERYGVEHNFQLLDNTGLNNTAHDPKTKDKRIKTNLERYGVEHALQNKEILEKQRKTSLERYGDEFPLRTEKGMTTYRNTMNLKYGVDFPMQSPKLVERFKESRLNNFSVRQSLDGLHGFVYITYFTELDLFKIGVTNNIKSRHNKLKNDFGEFNIIEIFESNNCYVLESYLHKKFSSNRTILNEGCGKTEFFKLNLKDINNINLYDLPDLISF